MSRLFRSALRIFVVTALTFCLGYLLLLLQLTTMLQMGQLEIDNGDYANERLRLTLQMAQDQIANQNREVREYLESDEKIMSDFNQTQLHRTGRDTQSENGDEFSDDQLTVNPVTERAFSGPIKDVLIRETNYTKTIPPDDSCFFEDRLSGEGMPDIHSAFIDPIAGYIIFNAVKFLKDKTDDVSYIVDYPDGISKKCNPIVKDDNNVGFMPQYLVIITCDLPDVYRLSDRLVINLRNSENHRYSDITVCTSGASLKKKKFLAICTMVKSVDSFIPTWLDVHRFLGVEHVYMYDNEDPEVTTLPSTLKRHIDDGFVTYIRWRHSITKWKTYLETQIAHEMDCIWRHKYDVEWMIKIDVDEYVQPMDPNRSKITDYLHEPIFHDLAGLRICNWFFGRPERIGPGGVEVIQRNKWAAKEPSLQQTGHDKNILRPINVYFFKIHNVKKGGNTISMDPYTELRLVHYRSENKRTIHFEMPPVVRRDYSMMKILKDMWEANNITEPSYDTNERSNSNGNKTQAKEGADVRILPNSHQLTKKEYPVQREDGQLK